MASDVPPLLWMAPALSGGGYSSEALAFAQGLARRMPNNWFRLRQFAEQPDENFLDGLPTALTDVLRAMAEGPNDGWHKGVTVCHAPPDAWKPSKFAGWDELSPCPPPGSQRTIGRTMYETDSLPADWVARCNRMDSVWVPTAFHLETFRRAGVHASKLVVVGEAVDGVFFDPDVTTPLPLPPLHAPASTSSSVGTPFRFLSVFKWELRKGWDALLRAYFAEFDPTEPVELVLKTRPFHSSADFDGLIAQFASKHALPTRRAAVRVIDSELPLRDLPRLYALADAFVLPSRGEGWGRPHVEAMAMAVPVIATNWSGPTAYLDEEVGYPLDYTLEPVAAELNLQGHNWAEPSVTHLRALMRHVVTNPDEARARGRAARERMLTRFSPDALAEDVLRAIGTSTARRKDKKEEL